MKTIKIVMLVVLIVVFANVGYAQYDHGGITGTIYGDDLLPYAGGNIYAVEINNTVSYSAISNFDGTYSIYHMEDDDKNYNVYVECNTGGNPSLPYQILISQDTVVTGVDFVVSCSGRKKLFYE